MLTRQLDDWLERYLELTQGLESPMQYNLWTGISAISSCLQRKCYCNWGLRGYEYPNFYVALVGPPGGRKGTAMRPAKVMLEENEVQLGSDALGSSQVLYKELKDSQQSYAEHNGIEKVHKSLSFWADEFVVFLSDKDPRFLRSLCDLYDSPNNWKYSSIGRGVDDISNCWLNIVGGITPALLQSVLSAESIGGGLVSRIIFVVGYGASKRIALPFLSPEDEKLQQHLTEDLAQIKLLSGPFILTEEFLTAWTKWYEGAAINEGVDNDKFQGYNARRAKHISKLCMIISAAENNSMMISAHHFEKAKAIIASNEKEMPNAFYGVGVGDHAEVYTNILRHLEGQRNFSFDELATKFQLEVLPHDLEQHINLLERTGKIKGTMSTTGKTRYDVINVNKEVKTNPLLLETLYKRIKQ